MQGPGIYHGTLNFQSTTDDFIDGAQLFQYPSFPVSPSLSNEFPLPPYPISMALTEFHLVLLYSDRIAAISVLNENLVYEEVLPLVSIPFTIPSQAHFGGSQKYGEIVRALT